MKYTQIDSTQKKAKLKIDKIIIERVIDDSAPDYLGNYSDTPGKYAVETNRTNNSYKYFNAENVADLKEARQNFKRMENYNNNNWYNLGVKATAIILIPNNSYSNGSQCYTIQKIHSGGLYGIESDSGEAYIKNEEEEQLHDLKIQLKALSIKIPENVKIERKGA